MRIELEIEALAIHGLPVTDRSALVEAVRSELGRLAASRDPATLAALPDALERLDAGVLTLRPGMPVTETGHEIARAVWRGLVGGSSGEPVGGVAGSVVPAPRSDVGTLGTRVGSAMPNDERNR